MALEELNRFMSAIRQIESTNRYDAVGPYTGPRYGSAQGAYQIMETIWPGWAREAGVDPSDFSPAAQDRVAEFKMRQYYNRYGDWDLVAVAWFAGPGRANTAQKHGLQALANINDKTATTPGTSVPNYVKKMRQAMGRATNDPPPGSRMGGQTAQGASALASEGQKVPTEAKKRTSATEMSDIAQAVLTSVSARIRENAPDGAILDVAKLFGLDQRLPDTTAPLLDNSMQGLTGQEAVVEAEPRGGAAPPPQVV